MLGAPRREPPTPASGASTSVQSQVREASGESRLSGCGLRWGANSRFEGLHQAQMPSPTTMEGMLQNLSSRVDAASIVDIGAARRMNHMGV
jgi:hypothetical protein